MGTRLRVALVGQAAEHRLIKVEVIGTPTAVREQLITKALDALGVQQLPARCSETEFLVGS